MLHSLLSPQNFIVQQAYEAAEHLGLETRNRYRVFDEQKRELLYCAEQGKGLGGLLLRQWLGHRRSFRLHFFTPDRQLAFTAERPWRWWRQELRVHGTDGKLWATCRQRRLTLARTIDITDGEGRTIWALRAPILSFRAWHYYVRREGQPVATISRTFSGLFRELFTDADNYLVTLVGGPVSAEQRAALLALTIFVDLLYFEREAGD